MSFVRKHTSVRPRLLPSLGGVRGGCDRVWLDVGQTRLGIGQTRSDGGPQLCSRRTSSRRDIVLSVCRPACCVGSDVLPASSAAVKHLQRVSMRLPRCSAGGTGHTKILPGLTRAFRELSRVAKGFQGFPQASKGFQGPSETLQGFPRASNTL